MTGAIVIGAENVCPPSVETAATCRLGTCLLSAFSVQNASTVPVLDTVICPVSRKPWAELLATALTCTPADQVRPSSSECAIYSLTLPLPEHLLQNTAQNT